MLTDLVPKLAFQSHDMLIQAHGLACEIPPSLLFKVHRLKAVRLYGQFPYSSIRCVFFFLNHNFSVSFVGLAKFSPFCDSVN